jgi:cytochrome b
LAPGGGKPDIAAIQADPQFAALKPLRNTVWQWHKYFGFALATLFMYRIALEFFQPGDEKFTGKIKSARNYLKLPGADLATGKHYLRVKLLYTAFYISLSFLVITGLTLAFFEDAENLKPVKGAIKEFHEFNMYMVLIFITLHVAGVILAELGKYKGVVSGMINGGKQP